jgi:alpha-mannosidase
MDAYFDSVEKANPDLPVHNDEFNYVFEGCYTSQSNVKLANRVSENILPEIEAISLVAGAAAGFPYPMADIRKGWRMAMFNQFHDILPGSGIHATYEYSQGLFQEIQAIAGAVRTRALRRLAAAVDTSFAGGTGIGDGIGAGAGDPGIAGGVTAYNVGAPSAEPVLVFNQLSWPRSEMVTAKVWNKELPGDRIVVRDDKGKVVQGQVVGKGHYWGHNYTSVLFPANDIPATGYKTFAIDRAAAPVAAEGVKMASDGVMENEFIRVKVDPASGAIVSLVDKRSGQEMAGGLLGVLEYVEEAPNGMSAWTIGQIKRCTPLDADGEMKVTMRGPHRAAVKTTRKLNDSKISVEISLNAGSPRVDFTVVADWLERGSEETGTPMLRIAFPTSVSNPKATYEIAFGSISRPASGQEVPALRWADLSGAGEKGGCGILLVNDSKYGHSADGSTLRLTLLRSSFGPDPLPEMGEHTIRFAITPHARGCPTADAMRQGAALNLPMNVVSTDAHPGSLPTSKGFVEVLTPNVILAAIKKAEDGDGVIVRLYEVEGKATDARVRLADVVKPGSPAAEVDLMERALGTNTAQMDGDVLTVHVPAYGIATVSIGA